MSVKFAVNGLKETLDAFKEFQEQFGDKDSKSKILIGEPIMPSSIILSQVWTQLGLKQPKCSKTIQDFAMNY